MRSIKSNVSILMTVFNAGKYLNLSIKSILNQSYKNLELIIVDDFSTDHSRKILNSFKDRRIKLFLLKKHIGRTPALNYGLKKTKGDHVAILDADDIAHKDRIQIQQKFLSKNHHINIVGSRTRLIDKNGKFIKLFKMPKTIKELNKVIVYKNVFPHSSIMFNKKFLNKIGNYPKNLIYAQDYGLILKFAIYGQLYSVPKILTSCRVMKTSMTYNKEYSFIRLRENTYLLFFVLKNFKLNFKQLVIIYFKLLKNFIKIPIIFFLRI
jgi:glycosyltransferase involved in cell wall biosynthesis